MAVGTKRRERMVMSLILSLGEFTVGCFADSALLPKYSDRSNEAAQDSCCFNYCSSDGNDISALDPNNRTVGNASVLSLVQRLSSV